MTRITNEEVEAVDVIIADIIQRKGDVTISTLIQKTGKCRSRVSRIIDRLVQAKRLRRTTKKGIPYLRQTDHQGKSEFFYGRDGFDQAVNGNLNRLSKHLSPAIITNLRKKRDGKLSQLLKENNAHVETLWKKKKYDIFVLELGSKAIRYAR